MDWLRERRKELRFSQEDLARMLQLQGYSVVRSTVGHWESGHASPPMGDPAFVGALARILRMDVMTILQHSGYAITTQHSETSERIARLVDGMSEEKQRLALRLVESLLDDTASV